MSFSVTALILLGIILILSFLYYRYQKQYKPSNIYSSSLTVFPKIGGKQKYLFLLPWLLTGGLISLAIAFIDPHTYVPRHEKMNRSHLQDPKEGRMLFLVIDQSGSMKEPVQTSRSKSIESKLSLVKAALKNFIQERPSDMLGLVAFARTAQILDPPTLDHEAILDSLSKLNIIQGENQDGTAIGYALYKTATLMASLKEQTDKLGDRAPYDISGQGIILLTDGLQDPNPLDKDNPTRSMELSQAAEYAKSKGIKLYVINVEPRLNTDQYRPNLNEMKRITEVTGGAFYMIERPQNIEELMNQINQLEKSRFNDSFNPNDQPTLFEKIDYAFPFIVIGFILILLWLSLKLSWLRSYP